MQHLRIVVLRAANIQKEVSTHTDYNTPLETFDLPSLAHVP